jgi:hypothetical protein
MAPAASLLANPQLLLDMRKVRKIELKSFQSINESFAKKIDEHNQRGYLRRELAQHDFCLGWLEQILIFRG